MSGSVVAKAIKSPPMSYQVLARKWRPKSFSTLVGQEHVVRALSHALSTGRLHHAWLFTGTRGVGKTTISRILAKALNCESGVTAEPCGICAACTAIDADRFPDYVEMDAASNRGVDDMAALLEQAVYAPVQGRYKVYMIDEVHMLTGHAFNAMLKTLEEPPEHVKFILATTDPQKIPVTVLSRCLQFNLKQMPPGHIVDHLGRILEAENVPFEAGALRHIAKAAAGSMRDALSLLDQSIAHGAGEVVAAQVESMLGTVGDDHLYAVLDALAASDVDALLAVADAMEARSLSFDAALQALASLVHRIALAQFAPEAIADRDERARLMPFVEAFDPEFVQLAYQIAVHGRNELALAPDEYAGFTMTLLRLHAFRPQQPAPLERGGTAPGPRGNADERKPLPKPEGSPMRDAENRAPAPPRPVERAEAVSPASRQAPEAVQGAMIAAGRNGGDVPPWEALPEEALGAEAGTDHDASAVPMDAAVMPAPPESGASRGGRSPTEDSPLEIALSSSRTPKPFRDAMALPGAGSPDGERRDGGRVAPIAACEEETAADAARLPEPPGANSPVGRVVPSRDDVVEASPAPSRDGDSAVDAALDAADWHVIPRLLGLGGMVRELAQHCEWGGMAGGVLQLRLSPTHHHLLDLNPDLPGRLEALLAERSRRAPQVRITLADAAGDTPALRDEVERRARHAAAVEALERDPFVRELIERFDATLEEASVKPL